LSEENFEKLCNKVCEGNILSCEIKVSLDKYEDITYFKSRESFVMVASASCVTGDNFVEKMHSVMASNTTGECRCSSGKNGDRVQNINWTDLVRSSARQHPSYGDCLEVKREYYQNCSVLGCVTMVTVSSSFI